MKLKFCNQLESNDCGPACLVMVAGYYDRQLDLRQAKELCAVTRMGVSVKDILDGGRKLGLECSGLKLHTAQLSEIPLPAILYWKQDHFVVLHKISQRYNKTQYHLADPAYGKITIGNDLLEKEWLGNNPKGVVVVFQQGEEALPVIKTTPPKDKLLIKELIAFAKSNRLKYAISFSLLLLALASNWAIPLIFRKVIDQGIIGKSINLVLALLLAQFLLFAGNFTAGFFSDLILTKFNFLLSVQLKGNFLKKLIRLPVNYFDTRLNTDTLQRLSDLSKVQSFLTWKGVSLLINILNLTVFSGMLLYLNRSVFLIFLVLSVLSIIWVGYFLKRRAILEYSMFIRQSENSNNLYEFIMNMPEIKVNHAQNSLISRITALQKKLHDLELRSLYLNMYQLSGANFLLKLREVITIALAAWLIIHNNMTIGTLLSISYIMGQLNGPIINLINNIRDAQDAAISNKRVEDVYSLADEEDQQSYLPGALQVTDITLQDVTFKYPGSFNAFVLSQLSFQIPKNKITAIVGTSGSGKTTLMKLLLLYYPPTAGSLLLGDTAMTHLHPDEWRKQCGVVLQNGHIFSGTILYNITLCEQEDVNEERVANALRIACLEEFISDLPMGYHTKIGNVGMQISGGQMQRILIARAVYKDPEFIFFDEATSSLDANTEKVIMNNLTEFFKGKTVVVIAHRLSTVKNADQIIVMEKGKIIETGSHQELVYRKDKYYALVKNQLELG